MLSSLAVPVFQRGITVDVIVALCFVNSLCSAVMDVVVDGLMVIMAKKDPLVGSEDLQTFSWVMYGVGGVIGSIIGGEITNNLDPYDTFYVIALVGLIISLLAFMMDHSLESEPEGFLAFGFCARSKLVLR